MSQNHSIQSSKKSTFEQTAAGIGSSEAHGGNTTKHTVETNHPVYKTKILVVNSIRNEIDYPGEIKSQIARITQILPVNIPRSLIAILFTLIIVPVIFSPGIFMPDFLAAAGGGVTVSQFKFPEAVFKNLNFDNRDILKSQIDHLITSYNKRLKHYCPESEISKLIASRIITAEYIWMNATDDLFFDYMMAQIANIKIKPYFGYARNSRTPNRTASLGRWAVETERIDYEKKLVKFMQKYPEIYEKANFDRLEKISDLITEAVMTHTYIVNETKTVIVEYKKPVKKVKKSRRKSSSKRSAVKKDNESAKSSAKEENASAPAKTETAVTEPVPAPAPAPAPEPEPEMTPAPAPEPVPAPEAAPAPKEDPKNKAKAKPKQDKKAGRVTTPAPAAPAPAETAPAPAEAPANPGDMVPPPAPEPMPEPPQENPGN